MFYGTEMNMKAVKRSAMFGGVVAAGLLASGMVAPGLAAQSGANSHWVSAKTLEHRVIEVGVGTGAVVFVNNYVYATTGQSTLQVAGIVLVADFIGEYIADYATAQPLSYFA